jgi:Domain of unknown function (DUF2017)
VLARRFHRTPRGEIRLRLPEEEQQLLRQLAAETRELIGEGEDPALRRLRPAAYEDPELEREYRELTGRHLADSRDRALILVEETVGRDVLSAEEADAWLRALNDVRLVLGTKLDVTEDLDWDALSEEDPRLPELAVYSYVSWIQEQLVEMVA